jgi:hypothetical protein
MVLSARPWMTLCPRVTAVIDDSHTGPIEGMVLWSSSIAVHEPIVLRTW